MDKWSESSSKCCCTTAAGTAEMVETACWLCTAHCRHNEWKQGSKTGSVKNWLQTGHFNSSSMLLMERRSHHSTHTHTHSARTTNKRYRTTERLTMRLPFLPSAAVCASTFRRPSSYPRARFSPSLSLSHSHSLSFSLFPSILPPPAQLIQSPPVPSKYRTPPLPRRRHIQRAPFFFSSVELERKQGLERTSLSLSLFSFFSPLEIVFHLHQLTSPFPPFSYCLQLEPLWRPEF